MSIEQQDLMVEIPKEISLDDIDKFVFLTAYSQLKDVKSSLLRPIPLLGNE